MKKLEIAINDQVLSEVRTRAIPDRPTRTVSYMGKSDVFVQEDDGVLSVRLYAMTLAQLFYDAVLPQDRSIPVAVEVGRRKPRPYLIDDLATKKDHWRQDTMILRLVPV